MSQLLSKQFVTFLVTGGIAAVVNFGSRILFNLWMDFSAAIVLAYICGMTVAFLLARSFVFTESKQNLGSSALYFVLVNLFAILQTWGISLLLAYYVLPALNITMFTKEIAHAIGIIVPVFSSYFGHKYLSFR